MSYTEKIKLLVDYITDKRELIWKNIKNNAFK